MTSRPIPLLLVALLLLSSLAPLASAGEAWTKETGSAITAVATDERGEKILICVDGATTSQLTCFDSAGTQLWTRAISSKPTKLAMAGNGEYFAIASPEGYPGSDPWRYIGGLYDATTGSLITGGAYGAPVRDCDISHGDAPVGIWAWGSDLILATPQGYISPAIPAPHSISSCAIAGDASWVVIGGGTSLTKYSLTPPPDNWMPRAYGRDWINRVSHSINGLAGSEQTNYTIPINVIRGSGSNSGDTLYAPQCRSDFGDVRFTASDGTTPLRYRHYSTNGTTATFLVELPTVPANPGSTSIYVYWNNPAATSTSDPTLAADIYISDDFNDGTINPALWTVSTTGPATVVETDGLLKLDTNGAPTTTPSSSATVDGPSVTSAPTKITILAYLPTTYQSSFYNYKRHALFRSSPSAYMISWGESLPTQLYWGRDANYTGLLASFGTWITHTIYTDPTGTRWVAAGDWDEYSASTQTTGLRFMAGFPSWGGSCGAMHIDSIAVEPWSPPGLHGTWGSVEHILLQQQTKTLDGTITNIDAPETGDWVAVSTTTKTYIIEVTPTGFGTVYSADRTGTPYDVAIANNGANLIEGRGILADIFRLDGVQVGTYTAGGPVRTVDIAQKNGLYAAAGSDDGKYYIFSKDESSSWYLLHSSDSEEPVTAIAMSWRGEIAVIGRADGSVVLYTTTDAPLPDSQMTVYIIKDGKPYIGKPVSVSTADISDPDEWTPLYNNLRTDSDGKIVISTHTGHYYQININNGEKIVVIQASSATAIHSVVFRSPLIYEKYSYDVQYNASSQAIEMTYTDNEGPATVSWSIVRTDTYSEVFSHTTSGVTTATATYPISEPDISYKVNVKVQRSSGGSIQNMWFITPQNASPIALPFWDENIQNAVFIIFLMILGGIFYYSTGAKGALIVALVAALFRYFDWITVPWFWIIAAVVFAFLANIAEGA